MIIPRPDGIPAIDAVDRHIDRVTPPFEELPLQLADGDRVVDDQDALGRLANLGRGRGRAAGVAEPLAAEQVVDRPDQILDVDDQDRPAVVEDRRAVDVGRFVEPGIERPDFEITLAEKLVDDQSEPRPAITDDDHRHRVVGLASAGKFEDLRRVDQAHELAIDQEVGTTFEPADLGPANPGDPFKPVEREGVGLAGDLDQ
jgi:hypothetical protein